MSLELRFICPLENGLHARPASLLAEIAGRYRALASLTRLHSGAVANCASVIELVAAGVMHQDECLLQVSGDEADAAFGALREFITDHLADCDDALPEQVPVSLVLPRALQEALDQSAQTTFLQGLPLSPGSGRGKLQHFSGARLPLHLADQPAEDPLQELGQLERALGGVELELSAQLEAAADSTAQQVLRASLALLRDPALLQDLHSQLGAGRSAAAAVVHSLEHFAGQLAQSDSTYLRERAADLRGIGLLLLAHLGVDCEAAAVPALNQPTVLLAETLSPPQLLALDRGMLAGLVLGEAGATSHAAILARSFGIPALAAGQPTQGLTEGEECIIDGKRGLLLSRPSAPLAALYEAELGAVRRREQRARLDSAQPASSSDGRRVDVAANIASADEAASALASGADGIGLFRTELLFYGRDTAPDEEEQYAVYRAALEALAGRELVFRTLDIGGDKPLDYLHLPREANPFLGQRGIRLYERLGELVDVQLRALLRASVHGRAAIMAPMLSTLEEAREFKARVMRLRAELQAAGQSVAEHVPLGVMIEVPSAALLTGQIGAEVDFISIGSNDLCQYAFAADRGNPAVSHLHNCRHPAFLRLLKLACDGAQAAGCRSALCGEMAGDPSNLPLLLGLGVDELSMSAPAIAACKSALRGLDSARCCELLEQACGRATAQEVEALLSKFSTSAAVLPLLAAELIELDSPAASKAQAIHALAQRCWAEGRTDDADALERDIWDREETYSTGLGHGFAIPHCKSSAAAHATLALLRPQQPIDWGSLDGAPVHTVILLAMPAGGSGAAGDDNLHLKVFAALARRLMREDFRDALSSASDPAAICGLLTKELDLHPAEVKT